ncbi:MAG TPA: NADH-quinone oxidoreductase subunit J [Ktedonobacterales bacterium]|jgi:NADH-quinone oxidoreductase subunit J|nr:NADH-quinone oxidoreductase subunit J [Ktedonobacterales bacterium]
MDIATIIFYLIAAALVGSALAVVVLRNIVHAALFLVLVFGAAAGIYVLLNAEFIAIVQILIYAGAVTILILFAIMLTHNPMARNGNPVSSQWWFGALVSLGLCVVIIYAVANSAGNLVSGGSAAVTTTTAQTSGSVVRIGQLLYSPFTYSYVLPFEVASVVLLVAIIGAIVIGREE